MRLRALTVSAILSSCAVLFVVSGPADAGDGMRHAAHVQRAHRQIPASAQAMSPSILAPTLRRNDDSDGLSRNVNDCNRGCIDN